jgi:gas vesicle protein
MNTTKVLMIAAIGLAIGLLATSDKGEDLRESLMDNANKWKKKLGRLTSETGDELADLKNMVSREIEGIGSDVRDRIMAILDEGADSAKTIHKKVGKQLS